MKNLLFSLFFTLFAATSFAQKPEFQLSSHILDITKGAPASGVMIQLEKQNEKNQTWSKIDEKITDENGRIGNFLKSDSSNVGIYRLTYLVNDYFKKNNVESFYPFIEVVFQIKDGAHYHVPITLSAFGYSTYRGN